MRILGTFVIGLIALLGSSAHAQLPVVTEARASWQGCDYSIKVLQDVDPAAPWQPLYRVSVQSAVVSSSTCTLTPRTIEMTTSKLTPQVGIAINAEGLAVAYTFGEYYRGFGNSMRARIHRLDPSTLSSLKMVGLQASYVPSNGGAGGPGAITLAELTLHIGYLEVSGTFTGNSITEDPATIAWPYPILQGNRFVSIYPDFFGTTAQSPRIVTF